MAYRPRMIPPAILRDPGFVALSDMARCLLTGIILTSSDLGRFSAKATDLRHEIFYDRDDVSKKDIEAALEEILAQDTDYVSVAVYKDKYGQPVGVLKNWFRLQSHIDKIFPDDFPPPPPDVGPLYIPARYKPNKDGDPVEVAWVAKLLDVHGYNTYRPDGVPMDNEPAPAPVPAAEPVLVGAKEPKPKAQKPAVDYAAWQEAYNTNCPMLPGCVKLTDKRKKAINGRISEGYTLDDFAEICRRAATSSFLRGEENRGNGHDKWKADFDFLTRADVMNKIMEGGYGCNTKAKKEIDPDEYL